MVTHVDTIVPHQRAVSQFQLHELSRSRHWHMESKYAY